MRQGHGDGGRGGVRHKNAVHQRPAMWPGVQVAIGSLGAGHRRHMLVLGQIGHGLAHVHRAVHQQSVTGQGTDVGVNALGLWSGKLQDS